jgi:hypothetical protein
MPRAPGPAAVGIEIRRDADYLHARPPEQHRQRAGVVGIAAEIGVDMDEMR